MRVCSIFGMRELLERKRKGTPLPSTYKQDVVDFVKGSVERTAEAIDIAKQLGIDVKDIFGKPTGDKNGN